MRILVPLFFLAACSDYDLIGEAGNFGDVVEDGPEIDVADDIALAPVYAQTSTSLFEVDPETGATELQGDFHNASGPVENFVDIAIGLDGRIWGGNYDRLYTIDPTSGRVTPVCSLEFEPFALTFGPNGVLYAGGADELVEMDTTNCSTRPLVSGVYTTSGDIVGLPDGWLYWTVRGPNNGDNDELVRVDPETGAYEWIGVIGADRLYGVGYSDGQLFGFSSDGEIVAVDPETARTTVLNIDTAISWWGATTNPVRW